ncbi:MAG: phospholipid carrier-dependent glycosyltransferase [Bifidobacteriaceae bacterium]|jgi:dolichyl-phosphate-mannose--protein O-mannosyl transferase|nr:phospholipid carrier-dependent glycosyltransferase [Bifidobacteriaceae bacterium]
MKYLSYLAITVLAGLLRIINLAHPNHLVFDETYYAKDAWAYINTGLERVWPEDPNAQFVTGEVDIYLDQASIVAHPPLGKLLIGIGMKIFGPNSFGWRIMPALFGTALVFILMLLIDHLLHSPILASLGGLYLSVDGLALVMSRTALLDIFLTFFILVAVLLYLKKHYIWMFIVFGLAMSIKWSALWFIIGFCVLLFFQLNHRFDSNLFQIEGLKPQIVMSRLNRPFRNWYESLVFSISGFLTSISVYSLSWWTWFSIPDAPNKPVGGNFINNVLALINYHIERLNFHIELESNHSYATSALGWPLQIRPTYFFYEQNPLSEFTQSITSLGNPLLWWTMTVAMIFVFIKFMLQPSYSTMIMGVGLICGWFPWIFIPSRTQFTFYAILIEPFFILGLMIAISSLARTRYLPTVIITTVLIITIIGLTFYFWPIWTGQIITHDYLYDHFWIPSWI